MYQKYHHGDLVRFTNQGYLNYEHIVYPSRYAIVDYSYSDEYTWDGKNRHDTRYRVILSKYHNAVAWVDEDEITFISSNRLDILAHWKRLKRLRDKATEMRRTQIQIND
jgi:hypothetical protein